MVNVDAKPKHTTLHGAVYCRTEGECSDVQERLFGLGYTYPVGHQNVVIHREPTPLSFHSPRWVFDKTLLLYGRKVSSVFGDIGRVLYVNHGFWGRGLPPEQYHCIVDAVTWLGMDEEAYRYYYT